MNKKVDQDVDVEEIHRTLLVVLLTLRSIICLWNSPYYTHSKQRSLNNSNMLCSLNDSNMLCLCIMTSYFPTRFKFYSSSITTGTYKFIQNYASYCSLLFFTSSKVFVYFFSWTFWPGPSLYLEVVSSSKQKGFRAGSVVA